MQLGACRLVLQDFNDAVLRAVTMPTVQLNGLWPLAQSGHVRFISGDWACVAALLTDDQLSSSQHDNNVPLHKDVHKSPCTKGDIGGFDVILSADTLYSTAASQRLWTLVRNSLRPGGTALIAAKSYYFGCGGSVAAFKALVSTDLSFTCTTVRTFEDGASNRRECFAVRRQHTGVRKRDA